jgi:hypothetical protein
LVAVDAEKLTMTSCRPPHKKSRQETQSTAAFFKAFYRVIGGNSGQWRGHGGSVFFQLIKTKTKSVVN